MNLGYMDASEGQNQGNSDCRVLVVEDNPLMKQTIESLLLAQDYTVVTSTNGEEALEILNRVPVDVVVCDVMMPKMDGYQLFRSIRESPNLYHIPFVFLTALDDAAEIERGNEIGVDDYVTKPFDPRELLSIIRGKVIRSRHLRGAEEGRYETFRKRVIHTLSHEFRTPLVAISTGTELLLDQLSYLEPEKAISLLSAVQRGGQRLERLVNDFMIVQQIESGAAKKTFESRARQVPLSKIFTELGAKLSELNDADAKRLLLRKLPSSDTTSIHVHPPHIVEIIYRLVLNGLKFSGTENVEIEFLISDEAVTFQILDKGPGFEIERINEASELFGQLDRQTHEQQGGGLGLPIASRLARINGGCIEFETVEGRGFLARLTVPVRVPEA